MQGPIREAAGDGFSVLAASLSRATALYVAMNITPAESGEANMLATADRLATWIDSGVPHAPSTDASGIHPWQIRE